MEIVKETQEKIIIRDYFEGTFEDYLGTDEGLDFINDWKKENPDKPFWGGAVKKMNI